MSATALERNARGINRFLAGDLDAAAADFDAAIAADPTFARAWNNRGMVRKHRGDVDAAAADFDAAIDADPEYTDALGNRAAARAAAGDLGGALADFARAVEIASGLDERAALLHNRAAALEAADPAAALADLDAALDLCPAFVTSLERRARLRTAACQFDGADADFDAALALTPPQHAAELYHARGALHVARKDFRAAVEDYDFALAVRPDFVLAYLSRGHARYHLRDGGALDDYREAFRLDAAAAARELARVVAADASKDAPATLKNCRQHIRICPTDAVAHFRLAVTLRVLGDLAESQEAIDAALDLAGDMAAELAAVLQCL